MAYVCLCRSPVRIICLASYQDACARKIGCRSVTELERNSCLSLRSAECHFRSLACRHVGQCIAESLRESFHHAAIDFPFRKFGHFGRLRALAMCFQQACFLYTVSFILRSTAWNVYSSPWNVHSSPWNICSGWWNIECS